MRFVVVALLPLVVTACPLFVDTVPPGEGEGEGEALPVEGEGEEGEGDAVGEGEGEGDAVGEGEGEGDAVGEGEGEGDAVGEGEGEGDVVGEGEGEGDVVGEGEGEGEGEGDTGALDVDDVLGALRNDRDSFDEFSDDFGWPLRVNGGFLFVSLRSTDTQLAGDVNGFQPEPMNIERTPTDAFAFAWLVKDAAEGSRYKFVDDNRTFHADPRARAYSFDDNGEMSLTSTVDVNRVDYPKLYARHFAVALPSPDEDVLLPRNVRVLIPRQPATRVLYVHDGQNVFARDSSIPAGFAINDGGWQLDESAPDDVMVVAIDLTSDRFVDYTPTTDTIGGGPVGGGVDDYADLIQLVIRPLIDATYGEPPIVGTMGSSLGGLAALAIADRYPDDFDFAAGLSSTFGWGSFDNVGSDDGDDTLIDTYAAAGHRHTILYIDSGGSDGDLANGVDDCEDSDGDGINDDDGEADDNFCETLQMRDTLLDRGYVEGDDLFYVYDAGPGGNGDAAHTESAWRFRARHVFELFEAL